MEIVLLTVVEQGTNGFVSITLMDAVPTLPGNGDLVCSGSCCDRTTRYGPCITMTRDVWSGIDHSCLIIGYNL